MSASRDSAVAMITGAFAVITGGGTSGHVLPALAIADGLVANGHRRDEIVYIGAQRGIETKLLPPTGYPHHLLDVIGLQRQLTASNLLFPIKMIRAVIEARRLMKSLRPAVVVSVGGYASFPATLAARSMRIPVVVVSYDRIPGLASRISARFANVSAVAFEGSRLPRARVTGAPVRRELTMLDRREDKGPARRRMGIPENRFLICVFGGSLGSKMLNEAVTAMVDHLHNRDDIAVRHVVGDRFLGTVDAERFSAAGIMYDVIGYEDEMVDVYAAADLMITRAGASTIAELSTAGMPAIIVPWAASADDHQSDNARILGDVGAAVVMSEAEVQQLGLSSMVLDLVDDPHRLESIASAAYACGDAHRSGRLTRLIEEMAAGR